MESARNKTGPQRHEGNEDLRDIEDAKRAEEKLAKVASFPLLNPNPIVEADLEGNVSFVNPAARRTFPDIADLGPLHPFLANWSALAPACRNELSTL